MSDILIACPNLSLDRTIAVDDVAIGHIHRSRRRAACGGGKGVNVARALACLGGAGRVVGFAAGGTGTAILQLLDREGIDTAAVEIDGESRSCLTVLAPGSTTVFNEEGPAVDAHAWQELESLVDREMPSDGIFICSGSWPPGSPPDAAARLTALAKKRGCFAICDTSRAQLSIALAAGPDLVKANVAEARSVLDPDANVEPADEGPGALDQAAELAQQLVGMGPGAVVCSAGSQGAVLARGDELLRWHAPKIEVVNPVGAGDSMVAGIAHAIASGDDLARAVAFGTVVAAASCETFPAGVLDGKRALELFAGYETSSSAI